MLLNYRSLFKDCWMSHSNSVVHVYDSESVYVYTMDLGEWETDI